MAKKPKAQEPEKIPTLAEFEAKIPPKPTGERTIKVKAIREFEIDKKLIKPGQEVLLSEEEAVEFCDRVFSGYHPFYGYMPEIGPLMEGGPNPLERKQLVRAVRVA